MKKEVENNGAYVPYQASSAIFVREAIRIRMNCWGMIIPGDTGWRAYLLSTY